MTWPYDNAEEQLVRIAESIADGPWDHPDNYAVETFKTFELNLYDRREAEHAAWVAERRQDEEPNEVGR